MRDTTFEIPPQLLTLIEKGCWPKNDKEAKAQNSKNRISTESLKSFAPDEDYIFLCPPPFIQLSEEVKGNKEFWTEYGAIDTIEPGKCLIIGDFGIGSDTVIILDYSENISSPGVKRLVWHTYGNYWETIASNFSEFIEKLDFIK